MKRRIFLLNSACITFLGACGQVDNGSGTLQPPSVSGLIRASCKVALEAASVVELVSLFFPGAVSLTIQQATKVADEYCKRFDSQVKPLRLAPGQNVDVQFDDGTTISGIYLGNDAST